MLGPNNPPQIDIINIDNDIKGDSIKIIFGKEFMKIIYMFKVHSIPRIEANKEIFM